MKPQQGAGVPQGLIDKKLRGRGVCAQRRESASLQRQSHEMGSKYVKHLQSRPRSRPPAKRASATIKHILVARGEASGELHERREHVLPGDLVRQRAGQDVLQEINDLALCRVWGGAQVTRCFPVRTCACEGFVRAFLEKSYRIPAQRIASVSLAGHGHRVRQQKRSQPLERYRIQACT